MNITVIGLGLIGGSFAKTLKGLSAKNRLIGSDLSLKNEKKALALGLVDECLPFEIAIQNADIILLAIPVDVIEKQLPFILDKIKDSQLVIDFGSTKLNISKVVKTHPKRPNYLAAHPMAGTENTGPDAAFAGLFNKKILIICDKELTNEVLLEKGITVFEKLNMEIIYMDSDAHDRHIAYVSHLSHVSSFMLGITVLNMEKSEKNIFNMAGSGFESTVRLAMSSPEMWSPIFLKNKKNVKQALSQYIEQLKLFEKSLDEEDGNSLLEFMKRANHIKKALNK